MADLPILFSAPMVRALLDGRKTQTRRVIKPQPYGRISMLTSFNHGRMEIAFGPDMKAKDGGPKWWRPLAQSGDRMWVRETWTHSGTGVWDIASARLSGRSNVRYRADGDTPGAGYFPSIFLPREFSRLTLYVTDVRVERLQDISEDDAIAEGAVRVPYGVPPGVPERDAFHHGQEIAPPNDAFETACDSYRHLWNAINGHAAWDANPWVSVTTFAPRLGNIGSLPATLAEAT